MHDIILRMDPARELSGFESAWSWEHQLTREVFLLGSNTQHSLE
jgi:hypothetical protein